MSGLQAQLSTTQTAFTSAVLAASSAWTAGSVIYVKGARTVRLGVRATGHASASGALWEARPVWAFDQAAAPIIGDNVWYEFPFWDGSYTATTLAAGTLPTGFDITSAMLGYALVKPYPLLLRPPVTIGASEVRGDTYVLDVAGAGYLCVMFREIGDTTNRTTVAATAVTIA